MKCLMGCLGEWVYEHPLNIMIPHLGQGIPQLPRLSCGRRCEDEDALFPTVFPEAPISNHFPAQGIRLDGVCCDSLELSIHSLD